MSSPPSSLEDFYSLIRDSSSSSLASASTSSTPPSLSTGSTSPPKLKILSQVDLDEIRLQLRLFPRIAEDSITNLSATKTLHLKRFASAVQETIAAQNICEGLRNTDQGCSIDKDVVDVEAKSGWAMSKLEEVYLSHGYCVEEFEDFKADVRRKAGW